MTDIIYFCSEKESYYNIDTWRHILSQWYQKSFNGSYKTKDLIYPMNYINHNYKKNLKRSFNCREQWMMALKALLFAIDDNVDDNLKLFEKIMNTNSPKLMKTLGRNVKGYNEDLWKKVRYEIVVNGNYLQFTQDNEMKTILINTKDREIVEAAWYDKVWGIGFNEKNAIKVGKDIWKNNGLNLLGKALMEVRNKIYYTDQNL